MRLALSLLAFALLVHPALAQRTGTRIGKDAKTPDGPAVLRMLAACVIERQPGKVSAFLRTLPGSPEQKAAYARMDADVPTCLDSDRLVMDNKYIRFKALALRPALAEAWIVRHGTDLPSALPDGISTTAWFSTRLAALPFSAPRNIEILALLDFGHCVALSDWPNAVAFLRAEPLSPIEGQRMKALVPHLGPCLMQGQQIKLDRASLRSALAESVWHIAYDGNAVTKAKIAGRGE